MNATLTNRYIAAVIRTIPQRQRNDVARELGASIADQVDARVAAGEETATAEREVLTDLGDPDALAAGYTDRPLQLIGPHYYLAWWRLLKVLWAIVPVCAAFGVALGMTLAGEPTGHIIGSVAGLVISVIVHIGFWTTLVFFIVERSAKGQDVDFAHEWSVDDLPEPKDLGAGFSELVAYLVWLVIAAGALVWDHLLGFAPGHPGLSFFAVGLWPWWMGALFVVMAAGALVAIAVYVRGAWTPAAAWAKTVLNVVVMAGVLLLITRGELIDPAFFPALIPADSAATVSNIVIAVIGFAVVGSGVWDSIDGFLKVRRGRAARG